MKKIKYFLFVTAFLLFGYFAVFAHGAETLTTNYHPSWNYYTAGVSGWDLYWAGYPQFGQGQWSHAITQDADGTIRQLRADEKAPDVPYDLYYPTPTEMIQWAQTNSGQQVIIYMVDRGTSISFRAVTGNMTGKDGRLPSEALNNLLLKQKNVPYYTTGGQIIVF